jgi:hypothetical protein
MSRNPAIAQANRSKANPLVLGTFNTTSLRYLKGRLGPQNKVIGYRDTNQTSNGGFGGGAYNHWFQINLEKPGWIIAVKGPPRPNYIQVSAYDLNSIPIQGRGIFDEDSISVVDNNEIFYPYLGKVMKTQSNFYNQFVAYRLDRGDDRYYSLTAGSYLICVSTTRNEPLEYELGIVVEFSPTELFISLEDEDQVTLWLQETSVDYSRTINVISPVTTNIVISNNVDQPNGFTDTLSQINLGFTVTVLSGSTWLIGVLPSSQAQEYGVLGESSNDEEFFNTIHNHSLGEWQAAWESEHQDTDKFPSLFIPLTDRLPIGSLPLNTEVPIPPPGGGDVGNLEDYWADMVIQLYNWQELFYIGWWGN